MKKKLVLTALSLILICPSITGIASEEGSEINIDSEFTAFSSAADSSLEEWTGYAKNTEEGIYGWDVFPGTYRMNGHPYSLANFPQEYLSTGTGFSTRWPDSAIFYTGQNFGSEFEFTGMMFNFQCYDYIYFNTSFRKNGEILEPIKGYRMMCNRTGQNTTLSIQKGSDAVWETVDTVTTTIMKYAPIYFDIKFADGVININALHVSSGEEIYNEDLSYDASGDEDYCSSGYIGFGTQTGMIFLGNLSVKYNSEKVYYPPEAVSVNDSFKENTVFCIGNSSEFSAVISSQKEDDIKSCTLYADDVPAAEMSRDGDVFSAEYAFTEKGVHKIKIVVLDQNNTALEFAENTVYASDMYISPIVFTDTDGNIITSAAEAVSGAKAIVSIDPSSRKLSAFTLWAAEYEPSGSLVKIYAAELSASEANEKTELTLDIPAVGEGHSITAFVFMDLSNTAPLAPSAVLE